MADVDWDKLFAKAWRKAVAHKPQYSLEEDLGRVEEPGYDPIEDFRRDVTDRLGVALHNPTGFTRTQPLHDHLRDCLMDLDLERSGYIQRIQRLPHEHGPEAMNQAGRWVGKWWRGLVTELKKTDLLKPHPDMGPDKKLNFVVASLGLGMNDDPRKVELLAEMVHIAYLMGYYRHMVEAKREAEPETEWEADE